MDRKYKKTRSDTKIAASTGRFVTINADLQIIGPANPVDLDDSDDDE
jgi:hypothetical protein